MSVSVRGISSGVDINGIIEELMQLERQPIRRNEAMIERNEQIAELWREVNSRLDTLNRTLPPLLQELTFTAPMPASSNEEVLTAKISGSPVEGSYRFDVTQMATYHSVASNPPTAGDRISSASSALNLTGTFYLGTGSAAEGIASLNFNSATTGDWLRGSFGAGFQAKVSGSDSDIYTLDPTGLVFAAGFDGVDGADRINVYMDSFNNSAGVDISADLEDYFTLKGWPVDLDDPLFVLESDGSGGWLATGQHGGSFAFLGDHPLGTFGLRGEIVRDVGAVEEVMAINNFDFQIRNTVDETGFIKISTTDSLLEVANKINAKASQTGVIASVVQANSGDYRLVLESVYEGSEGYIHAYDYTPLAGDEITYGADGVLSSLFVLDGSGNAALPGYSLETETAQDAEFTLNGLPMTRTTNTFTDVISGLETTFTGSGKSTLTVSPDIDSAVEEVSLFVEAVNEVNSYLRTLQENEKGPLQGSSDLMRIERQLRNLIHGIVSDLSGSSHLNQLLTYSGTTGTTASATATGQYTGTASEIELNYYASNSTWRYRGQVFTSGDSIDGISININSTNPSNQAKLTLKVSPPTTPLTYYNTPGSSHSNQSLIMSGTGNASAIANGTYTGTTGRISLVYSSATSSWLYNGNQFSSGDTIDGIKITLGSGTPANYDTLTLNATAPSDPRSYNSFAAVGVMASDEKGFLVIDTAALRTSLTVDAKSVYRLFAREAPVDTLGNARGPAGMARQMQSFTNKMIGTNGVVQSRQGQLQSEITRYQARIEMLERRMEMREARLVRQFTFMEQYIARIQEQTGLMTSFETMMSAQREQ